MTDVGEVTRYEADDGTIIEFSVEFKTINDWHARSVYNAYKQLDSNGFVTTVQSADKDGQEVISYVYTAIGNEYGIPEICLVNGAEPNKKVVYLPQVCDEHSFINWQWSAYPGEYAIGDDLDSLVPNDIVSYNFNSNANGQNCYYYGQYGFTIINGMQIVEDTDYLVQNSSTSSELLMLDNQLPTDVTDALEYDKPSHYYLCSIYEKKPGTGWNTITDNDAFGDLYAVTLFIQDGNETYTFST